MAAFSRATPRRSIATWPSTAASSSPSCAARSPRRGPSSKASLARRPRPPSSTTSSAPSRRAARSTCCATASSATASSSSSPTSPPAHGMNPETQALYAANRLTVTRQVKYSPASESSLDLVLSLNGLPIVTAELTNPMSGQTWRDAIWQYKSDRDPGEMIFRFKLRALVHFAVDPDEVHMTTKLGLKGTRFLPFNRGNGGGAGNPVNPGGYKTAYLWEQVWARDSLMDILARFLHLQADAKQLGGKTVRRETMIFPRYHQLDCVRTCEADAREQGAGRNYLIQHSAGSGKSNSIAWLAHRLASLHSGDDGVEDLRVVVVTDRRVLELVDGV